MRVGGTIAPNPSAVLDLNPNDTGEDTKRGLALPRVKLTSTADVTTIGSPIKGLYVYNVNTAGDVTPGVYYFDGVKWNRVVASGEISITDLAPDFINNIQVNIANNFTSELGDTIISYIANNVTQTLTDSIMANVTVSGTRGITIAGSGTSNIDVALPPGTTGQVLTFDGYNWFPATRGFDHDDIIKITKEIKDYLTYYNGKLYSAGNNIYINDTIINANAKAIGDSLLSSNSFVIQLGDSLAYYFTQTNLGDTIANNLLSNNTYITNLLDTLKSYLEDGNTLYTAGYGLNLDGTEFSADLKELVDSLSSETYITQFGDSLAYYINETKLGDTISHYLTENNEFITNVTNEIKNSLDDTNTLYSAGYGLTLDGTEFSANTQELADSLTSETYITQFGDSLAYYLSETKLGDTISHYLTENNEFITNVTNEIKNSLDDTNTLYTAGYGLTLDGTEFSVNFKEVADSLVTNNTFITNLGDELIENYFTEETNINKLDSLLAAGLTDNQDLRDSIVNIINNRVNAISSGVLSVASADNTVDAVTTDGAVDLSVNIKNVVDSITNIFNETTLGDTILNYITNNLTATTINLGDTIINYITNNFTTELGDTITNYITNNFTTELGDTITNYITNNFTTELGDTITNYITNNVTQELTDSIFANVEGVNGITVEIGTGAADKVKIGLPKGDASNTLLVWNNATEEWEKGAVSAASENITTLTNNNDGTYTYTNETSATSNINVVSDIYNYGDTLLSNQNFIENLIDTIQNFLEGDGNTLYSAGYGLNLDGTEFSADLKELADSLTSETYITQFGDSLAYYINETRLGDTISHYLTENNEFITNVTNEIKNSLDDTNTLYTAGDGLKLDGTEFSADFNQISDSLARNLVEYKELRDSIVNIVDSRVGAISTGVVSVSSTITGLNLTGSAPATLSLGTGAAAGKYLDGDGTWKTLPTGTTYTAGANIDITSDVISATNTKVDTIANRGGLTIDKSDNENYKVGFKAGTAVGQIWRWNGSAWELAQPSSGVKTVTVTINETDSTNSRGFFGTISGVTDPNFTVLSVNPKILAPDKAAAGFIPKFLAISSIANVNEDGDGIDWSLRIINQNIDTDHKFTIVKLTITYIGTDEPDALDATDINERIYYGH
ncbi:hypothetical protein FACS189434_09840 [Bacteroidia bacterium]|nr:hypothetical protein FACS189434_09840 [Bacteroidia bacterium]